MFSLLKEMSCWGRYRAPQAKDLVWKKMWYPLLPAECVVVSFFSAVYAANTHVCCDEQEEVFGPKGARASRVLHFRGG